MVADLERELTRAPWRGASRSSDELDVRSLLAAAATIVLDLERDPVALVERRHVGPLNGRCMDEHEAATAKS